MKLQLMNDLKQAMKNNDSIKKNTIQLIRATILQKEKDEQIVLTNPQILNIISKEKQKRLDALAQFENAQREDLIKQTNQEIAVLEKYLPEPASEYEIDNKITQLITENQFTNLKDLGKLIKLTKEYFEIRANGKLISDLCKKHLS